MAEMRTAGTRKGHRFIDVTREPSASPTRSWWVTSTREAFVEAAKGEQPRMARESRTRWSDQGMQGIVGTRYGQT